MGISSTARVASLLLLVWAAAVTRWKDERGDGTTATAENRYTLLSKNRLKIVSTYQVGDKPAEVIGTLIGSPQR